MAVTSVQANNKLMTTKEQKVSVRQEMASGGSAAPRQVIAIEPAVPDEVYVPYYDPAVVYGAWPYDEYPPYYFGYPDYIGPGLIGVGLAFGAAPIQLSQYRGKIVSLVFIYTTCSHCQEFTTILNVLAKEYTPRGVQFLLTHCTR
jgi:hypothetical protein